MKLYTCKVVSLEDFIVIYIYIFAGVFICGNLRSTQNKPSNPHSLQSPKATKGNTLNS